MYILPATGTGGTGPPSGSGAGSLTSEFVRRGRWRREGNRYEDTRRGGNEGTG
jgi:hypothetical protein